jgi:hypothetical protein
LKLAFLGSDFSGALGDEESGKREGSAGLCGLEVVRLIKGTSMSSH